MALALTIGPMPGDTTTDETLRAQWEHYGPYLRATQVARTEPWGFHRFEGGGAERPRLYPVDGRDSPGETEGARSAPTGQETT